MTDEPPDKCEWSLGGPIFDYESETVCLICGGPVDPDGFCAKDCSRRGK